MKNRMEDRLESGSIHGRVVGAEKDCVLVELEGGMQVSWPMSRISPGLLEILREGDPVGKKVRLFMLSDADATEEREKTAKAVLNEILNP